MHRTLFHTLAAYAVAFAIILYLARGVAPAQLLHDLAMARLWVFIPACAGSFAVWFLGETLLFSLLFSYFHSKSTNNQEHLNDPAYDSMVDKQRTLVSDDDRLKAVKDIQKYIADKAYAPFTVGAYRWVMVQPRAQSYQYSGSSAKMEETYARVWLQG